MEMRNTYHQNVHHHNTLDANQRRKKKKINHVSVKRKATLTQRVQKAMLDLDQYVDFSKSHTVH